MSTIRTIALTISLAGVLAAPALAQTTQVPAGAPAPVTTPVPDTGMKKTPPTPRTHHQAHNHVHAKPAAPAT